MHHKHSADCTIWPFGQDGRNRARQFAIRMLNRDFVGMTSAERRFSMSAFAEFRRPE